MQLQQKHIDAFDQAETLVFHSNFCPYLELKGMLLDQSPLARKRFRSLFSEFYGMNVAGLTDAFKDRFFEILFDGSAIVDGKPDFFTVLNELCSIRRKKGDYALPLSFVSKLVAMHLEASPIYDRHVLAFFGKATPLPTKPKQERIAWFIDFLEQVAGDYVSWGRDQRVATIVERLKSRDKRLADCDIVRLMDFLVWKVGNQKLLTVKSELGTLTSL